MEIMPTMVENIFLLIVNLCNLLLQTMLSPMNALLDPAMAGFYSSELLINFITVLDDYILPTCAFFINIVPPLTWSAILLFITFYIALYTVVWIMHGSLKILHIIKNIVPLM